MSDGSRSAASEMASSAAGETVAWCRQQTAGSSASRERAVRDPRRWIASSPGSGRRRDHLGRGHPEIMIGETLADWPMIRGRSP